MKTYLKYGGQMASYGFIVIMILYISGMHSATAKLTVANWAQGIMGLGITIFCIALGIMERRAHVPAGEDFSYGHAFGAGVMITLFAALFGIVTNLVYTQLINPDIRELIVQAQIGKWESSGMSSSQIERAEGMMRTMMNPALQAFFGFCGGMLFGTLISLVTAAFLKRPGKDELQPVS